MELRHERAAMATEGHERAAMATERHKRAAMAMAMAMLLCCGWMRSQGAVKSSRSS
jgi:hypothetical protein